VLASLHAQWVSGCSRWDLHQLAPQTEPFGATEVSRREYVRRLSTARMQPVTIGECLEMSR
jgi:Leu/Phe-tRNA-protein transferase